MKNILILLLLIFVGNSYANSGEKLAVATELPRVVLDAISEMKMGADHVLLMIQNRGLSPLSTLNDSVTIAIHYGANLPQGAVRTGRNCFIMDV